MNGTMKSLLIFASGAAIGSVVTWKLIESKYEQLVQEEITSIRDVFSKREAKLTEDLNEAHEKMSENKENSGRVPPEMKDGYGKLVQNLDYTSYSGQKEEEKKPIIDKPYVIPPEDFGEFDNYERVSLTYYADGALADENDELVEDVDDIIGKESLNHFGEYEDDSVHVRNDRLKCDYEILRDLDDYFGLHDKKPHRAED